MKILHIISSPKWEMSDSTNLGKYFIENLAWENQITTLDLNKEELKFLSTENIGYNYWMVQFENLSNDWKHVADLQQKYIGQLKDCDTIVISAPMRNRWIPANLKAYIDTIVKVKETIVFTSWWSEWLLWNIKNCVIVWSTGWIYDTTPMSELDFCFSYLEKLREKLWVGKVHKFVLWWANMDKNNHEQRRLEIQSKMKESAIVLS